MLVSTHSLRAILFTAAAAFAAAVEPAIGPAKWGEWPTWGDQGNGTFRNPVLPSDYSDLDCIRVGADYYAISSTFQFSPGVVILQSRDLVNWRILGHVVTDLNQISPELNWDRMNRSGRGIWAGAIRQHAGRFWIYFGTPDEGYFMSTAENPAGPWTPLHRVLMEAGWGDCCPFWDDDGQGYLVGTNFRDGYKTWLFKLTPDGCNLIPGSRVLLTAGARREDLRYVARPRFPLDEAKRTMARAGCDRMRHPPGQRHGRRRHCGFSGCSGSWGLRSPQNRSDCWPPPNRNPRWRRTPCSEPVTCFRAVPTPRNGWTATAPTHQTRNSAEHVSNCICLHCLHQNPSAPLIDREACRGSRKARKLMETNFPPARFQHQESYPSRFNSTPVRTALTSGKARTQNP